jgi:hypothetical protein
MIIEIAIVAVAVTSIFGSSLAFADRFLKRQEKAEPPSPFAERRRVLERQRQNWLDALKTNPVHYEGMNIELRQRIAKLDEELVALAKEESGG